MALLPYNYARSAGDPTKDEARPQVDYQSLDTQLMDPRRGPAPYQPNEPQRPAPPSGGASGAPQAPPRTFAQMQAEGYARPPMPTPAPAQVTPGSQVYAGDPNRPGAGYVNYNGQAMRVAGTTHAGQKGDPTAADRYFLDDGSGNSFLSDAYVDPSNYSSFVNGYHGADSPDVVAREQATRATFAPPGQQGANANVVPASGPARFAAGNGVPLTGASGSSGGGGFDLLGALTGGANGGGNGSGVNSAVQQALLQGLANPSPYGAQDVQNQYGLLGGNIDDQFALQRKDLGEEMARRGLGTSTIHAGRLNDLNIGQRSAKASLAQDLLHQYANSYGENRNALLGLGNQIGQGADASQRQWLQQLMGYGQQGFENDLATNQLNQNAQNNYQQFILSLLGLGYGG